MSKKRVLVITQEMQPYTTASLISKIARELPQYAQEHGMEIRILMPRYGTINERRHRLHEVVRLSGMNIIVDDDDYPLIIKVASLPGTRMQVYFLDNEEFFKRKFVFSDADEKPFDDNTDRMVFFCKGVIETVKKFGWAPDVVHCHGWMTSLVPFYLKTAYKNEPIFENAKIVYSVYSDDAVLPNLERFAEKASINNLSPEDLKQYINDDGLTLDTGAANFSDGVILSSNDINEDVDTSLKEMEKSVLADVDEDYLPTYIRFYKELLEE